MGLHMAMVLACRDLGSDCDHLIEGDSLMTIVGEMQTHAVNIHSYPETVVYSDDTVDQMRGAVKQSSAVSDEMKRDSE